MKKEKIKPNFSGVPGELVSVEGMGLVFGTHKRTSPYDPLLDQLLAAPKGSALKFGDFRARTSVTYRAKKKGLRVSFAESGGALYVRLDGHVDDDIKGSRRAGILKLLGVNGAAKTAAQVAVALREGGDTTIDGQTAALILAQMMRTGEVIHQEGDRWARNPKSK